MHIKRHSQRGMQGLGKDHAATRSRTRHRTTELSLWDFTDGQTSRASPRSVSHDNDSEGEGRAMKMLLNRLTFIFTNG